MKSTILLLHYGFDFLPQPPLLSEKLSPIRGVLLTCLSEITQIFVICILRGDENVKNHLENTDYHFTVKLLQPTTTVLITKPYGKREQMEFMPSLRVCDCGGLDRARSQASKWKSIRLKTIFFALDLLP